MGGHGIKKYRPGTLNVDPTPGPLLKEVKKYVVPPQKNINKFFFFIKI